MLKKTETDETIDFLSLVPFRLKEEGRAPCPPPPWLRLWYIRHLMSYGLISTWIVQRISFLSSEYLFMISI